MGLRKMVLLLGVGLVAVVGLGLYVVLVEFRGDTTSDRVILHGLVFPYDPLDGRPFLDAVTRVESTGPRGSTVLERAEGGWRLRKPMDARADPEAVQKVLSLVRNLRAVAVLRQGDAAAYGLQQPRLKVQVWIAGQRRGFVAGKVVKGQSAAEEETYIQVEGEANVLLVDNTLCALLERGSESLRDRRVFDPAAGEATSDGRCPRMEDRTR